MSRTENWLFAGFMRAESLATPIGRCLLRTQRPEKAMDIWLNETLKRISCQSILASEDHATRSLKPCRARQPDW
jgi:hypothetical protein